MNATIGSRSASARHRSRLKLAFLITSGVLILEIVGGVLSGSLALIADAGHMATDVAGIGLSLFAIRLGGRHPDEERTFGLLRAEILAAVVNAVLLFGVAAFVLWEAWQRLQEPRDVTAVLMLAIAIVGAAANALSLWLLHDAQRESLNLRGAYLEVLGDLLGSFAVVIAAVVIATTGFAPADAIASAVIAVLILPRTWKLLREATVVLLEATPRGVDMGEVRRHILETPGVADVHDLHAWTITSGMNVVSAHVVLEPSADPAVVLESLSDCLANDFDIEHSTFQLETSDRRRLEEGTHQ